ncbi:MAG: exodeoxyribonuclease VII large subunit [Rhodocyclaceae bacterium]|jgi:exodeoxyribonuclease VII large subunit|nr:exodeoxyribonuclease VII large subunit [Rhodocyclaceae bacterium]MBK9312314.1 exodeoxyribonuclease VII large subunit [Rhodocyclaceae bacterium]
MEILTVSDLNHLARAALEREFPLLWVAGEVSNLTRAPSGHYYFTLKDEAAQVRCAMFRSRAQLLPWKLENGQQVEAHALVTLYESRGEFQLNVEALRRAGLGRLYEAFLKLRDKLAAEGLFDEARKRKLPCFPRRIGMVTSPRAAALRDVVAALGRRAHHLPIIIYPTLVQGSEAAGQIADTLDIAGRRDECDVLLLVRGGGSLEDLWPFNEEIVARAIAACPLPIIAGIGHETDTTIADLAADRRAATPTAAAELASAGWFEARRELALLHRQLQTLTDRALERRMQQVDWLGRRLIHPSARLTATRQRLAHLADRLAAAGERHLARHRHTLAPLALRLVRARPNIEIQRTRLERLNAALDALNPKAALARGYALARMPDGQLVRSHRQLERGMSVQLQFAEGGADTIVNRIIPD